MMDHPADDTSELVTRYIADLLDRRSETAHCIPLGPVVPTREPERRLAPDAFRKEMVARFEQLRLLAKQTATRPAGVRDRRRRAKLRLLSWLLVAIVPAFVYSFTWSARGTRPSESVPVPHTVERHAGHPPVPSFAGRVVPDLPSSAGAIAQSLLAQPSVTFDRAPQGTAQFSPRVTDEAPRTFRRTLASFASSKASEVAAKQRASRIATLLGEAVNDRILGSSAAKSVASIKCTPDTTRADVAHAFVGEVLDAAGQVVGTVSGTYTLDPESLSATVLYHGKDRVEYGERYFEDKL